jgi:hypothetical protein
MRDLFDSGSRNILNAGHSIQAGRPNPLLRNPQTFPEERQVEKHPSEQKAGAQERRAIWGWALYDWANSAFATTVMAAFFPVFFKQEWSKGVDVNLSTARLGLGIAAASLMIALMAPVWAPSPIAADAASAS